MTVPIAITQEHQAPQAGAPGPVLASAQDGTWLTVPPGNLTVASLAPVELATIHLDGVLLPPEHPIEGLPR
jgi:hypothetical protein